jgi:hypothetical protein
VQRLPLKKAITTTAYRGTMNLKDLFKIRPSRVSIDHAKGKYQKSRPIEKRIERRTIHKSPVKIKNCNTGMFDNARMVNYSDNGIYLETDSVLRAGTIIYLGIENSPFSSVSDAYDIYQAKILWRKGLKSALYKWGYGLRLILVSDNHDPPARSFKVLR